MKRTNLVLGMGSDPDKLGPVTHRDIAKLKKELGEEWGEPWPNDATLRYIPMSFVPTLVIDFDFNVKIIRWEAD